MKHQFMSDNNKIVTIYQEGPRLIIEDEDVDCHFNSIIIYEEKIEILLHILKQVVDNWKTPS